MGSPALLPQRWRMEWLYFSKRERAPFLIQGCCLLLSPWILLFAWELSGYWCWSEVELLTVKTGLSPQFSQGPSLTQEQTRGISKCSYHLNPAKVHYWLRGPRVSNRQSSIKVHSNNQTDVKSYIYLKPNHE